MVSFLSKWSAALKVMVTLTKKGENHQEVVNIRLWSSNSEQKGCSMGCLFVGTWQPRENRIEIREWVRTPPSAMYPGE
jgi:hypothetical protein